MSRVSLYIDGFNLYFGLKERRWRKYYWLDHHALGRRLLREGQVLVASNYFTSRIRSIAGNDADVQRQAVYLDALGAQDEVNLHFGHYLIKPRRCASCHATWTGFEEKMTDVNIAVRLLADAMDDVFDVALVVSADSDLVPPISELLRRFPTRRVVVVWPPKRHSNTLKACASADFHLSEAALRQSQLPDRVQTPEGRAFDRPATWSSRPPTSKP